MVKCLNNNIGGTAGAAYFLFPTQFPHYLYTLYRFFYIMDTEDIRPMK